MKNKKNGFTIVELMIIIAILGILAAVAIPMITHRTHSSLGDGNTYISSGYSSNCVCR
jgi:type IV pilus assembly protein PilA